MPESPTPPSFTPPHHPPPVPRTAFWLTLSYLLAGVLWILLSSYLVQAAFPSDTQPLLEMLKGIGFVAVTSLLLYLGMVRFFRRAQALDHDTNVQIERQLYAMEERNRAIVLTAAEAIITVSETGMIESFNPAAERLFGYSAAEIAGEPISKLIESEKAQVFTATIRARRKNGAAFLVDVQATLLQMSQSRAYLYIMRDVTEQMITSTLAAQHVQQLSVLNRILQIASSPVAFESMLDTLLREVCEVFDADAADIHQMDTSVDLLYLLAYRGYEVADSERYRHFPVDSTLRGKAIHLKHVVTFINPQEDDAPAAIKEKLKALAVAPIWASGTIRGTLAVNLWYAREFSSDEVALLEALGHSIGVAIENARLNAETQSYAETLRIKVEERTAELQKALVHAQGAERTKSALLSTVSHEMRTPLSSIIGFSNLILSRKPALEKTLEYSQAINFESRRLADLINDFLDLQRIESGREVFHFIEVDLTEIVQDIIQKQQLVEDDSHSIQVDLSPVPLVYADGARLRQVIVNLLANAIKYSPNGGDVLIKLKQEQDEVQFSIQDQGLGISPEDLSRIFEQFYRSQSAERYRIRGTGLGLGLCKEIVKVHNGRIWAESPGPNLGSTFTFAVPIVRESRQNAPFVSKTQHGIRVIVVDDDTAFSTYLAERLDGEGYTVTVLDFKAATASHLQELGAQLVILDVMKGEERPGWVVLADLKQHERTAALPVIVCSVVNLAEQSLQSGAASFVAKPVDETFLMAEIVRLVPGQRVSGQPVGVNK